MSSNRASRSRQGSQQRSAQQRSQHAQAGLGGGEVGVEDLSTGGWSGSGRGNGGVEEDEGWTSAGGVGVGASAASPIDAADVEESSRSTSSQRRPQRPSTAAPPPTTSSSPSSPPPPPEATSSLSLSAVHVGGAGAAGGRLLQVPAGPRRSSQPTGLRLVDPSAVVALLDDEEGDDSRSLLSPSSPVRAEDRLNALIYPESAYSSSKSPIRSFYHSQNEFIDSLKKLVLLQHSEELDEAAPSTAAYLAIQISLALTFVLLGLKLFTAIYSDSIAVVASAVDSGLDVLSQGTLLLISRAMKRYDPYHYPAGKNRMEPVAVLLFSVIMGMAALFLLYESLNDLLQGLDSGGKHVKMDAVTVIILCVVVGVQLLMWVYCRRVAALNIPGASAADALAQDHINDVFINIIGGVPAIIAGFIPSAWLADPIGGMCLSVYIIIRWTLTAWEQVPAMTGRTADPSFLNQLTYLAGTHDPRILKVDTILAYHVGIKYQCEVHIVLAEDMLLREAHDIGETLEQKIERLDRVEMAFVHLDYEYEHKPEHAARAKAAGKDVARLLRAAAESTAVGAAAASEAAADAPTAAPPSAHLSAAFLHSQRLSSSVSQLLDATSSPASARHAADSPRPDNASAAS